MVLIAYACKAATMYCNKDGLMVPKRLMPKFYYLKIESLLYVFFG